MTAPWPFGEQDGFCLVMSRRRLPLELLTCYGVDPADVKDLSRTEALALRRPGSGLSLLRAGRASADWSFVFEEGGTRSLSSSVQAALSAGTETITLSDTPEAVMTYLLLASNGRLVASQEVGSDILGDGPECPGLLAQLEALSVPGDLDTVEVGLRVLQERTGVRFVRDLLDPPLPTAFTAPETG